jgi:hypothetical protein
MSTRRVLDTQYVGLSASLYDLENRNIPRVVVSAHVVSGKVNTVLPGNTRPAILSFHLLSSAVYDSVGLQPDSGLDRLTSSPPFVFATLYFQGL